MDRSSSPRDPKAGFTIIELVVALVIISILASFAIINYRKVQVHAEAAAISQDLHLMEDAIIRGIISGAIGPDRMRGATSVEALKNLIPDENPAVFDPELPEGMEILLFGSGTRTGADYSIHILNIAITDNDGRHQAVLDALAAMRPITSEETGSFVVEQVDYRTAAVLPANPGGGS
jgi:prepilin-type N-terminal cleavage/methylation domain-containing protein